MAAEPAAATAESAAAAEAAPGGSPGPTGGSPSFSLTVRFISGDTLTVTASAAEKVSRIAPTAPIVWQRGAPPPAPCP